MGNISSYLQSPNVVTQCIRIGRQNRKRKTLHSQQLMDINSDSDDDEKIIFYSRKDDSLKKKTSRIHP